MSSVALVTDRLKIPWAVGAPLTSPSRRLFLSPVGLALLGGTLLVVLLKLVDWTAELLWFRALGYEVVFWRLLFAEVAMFATAFIPVFVYVLLNLLVLARLADLQSLLRGRGPAGIPQSWPTTRDRGGATQRAPAHPTSHSWVGCNGRHFRVRVLWRVGSIPALGLGPGFRDV